MIYALNHFLHYENIDKVHQNTARIQKTRKIRKDNVGLAHLLKLRPERLRLLIRMPDLHDPVRPANLKALPKINDLLPYFLNIALAIFLHKIDFLRKKFKLQALRPKEQRVNQSALATAGHAISQHDLIVLVEHRERIVFIELVEGTREYLENAPEIAG